MADLAAEVGELLKRSLKALNAYQTDIILVGGLVPFLYQYLPGFDSPQFLAPVATKDIDLSVEPTVPKRGAHKIPQALHDAGFYAYEERDRRGQMVHQAFQLEDHQVLSPNHVEFIAPMRGRDKECPAKPQPGLIAQQLRYVDLLRAIPVEVNIPSYGPAFLPHPLCYILQKVCIRKDRRKVGKHIKDQADVFYVVWALSSLWQSWPPVLEELRTYPLVSKKWLSQALVFLQDHYSIGGSGPAEIIRAFGMSKMPADYLTPENIRTIMRDFCDCLVGKTKE